MKFSNILSVIKTKISTMTHCINNELLKKLNALAPLYLAESWDNVGMLIEPQEEIKINRIMLTNDLSLDVLNEVKEKEVEMIISYHPPLFHGFKRLRPNNWKELIVSRCVKNNYYVYSPHTALDSVNGGVNDWILSIFDVSLKFPIREYKGNVADESTTALIGDEPIRHGSGRYCTLRNPISLSKAIDLLKKHLKLPHLLLAKARNHNLEDPVIKTIAVCAGSGVGVLKLCDGVPADLWISGEMSHHDLLDATDNVVSGTSVILTAGHSNSERGYLSDVMQPWLQRQLASLEIQVLVSQLDRDPLSIV